MAVIYLFDATKNFRKMVKKGVQEIVHREGEYEAMAQTLAVDVPVYGDYFGFRCADGRFRLFAINNVETDDETGTCMFSGPDAAIAELEGKVLTNLTLQNTTAVQAITEALKGTGWKVGNQTGDGPVNIENAYFATRWAAIKRAAAAGGVRVVPYYDFANGAISARMVDVLDKTPVFSGLIYTRKRGAQNIKIVREGRPYGRVYPIGKIIGSSEPPEQLTIADVAWSTENGDPVDKPAGQLYIDLPNALTSDEYVYEDKSETDSTRLMRNAFDDLRKTQTATASGTASISDMGRIPGYEHMAAQMWMRAVVRAENGEMVDTTIINIERYHVHTELTNITVGDENSNEDALENMLADMRTDLADAAKVAGGGRAKAEKAEDMVIEAEKSILLQSQQIALRAFSADVQKLAQDTEVRFREAYVAIDANGAAIGVTETQVNNLTNEVTNIGAKLNVMAGEISSKVSRGELISEINQTPGTVRIDANKINLDGYVKFGENAEGQNVYFNGSVGAQWGSFTNISLINYECSWHTLKMGQITAGEYLGQTVDGAMDLNHSHAVSIDGNTGLVTLGEVSATGGNFNIADTQYYKNGVSAAYTNGKTDWSPVNIERTSYSTADKTVTVRAVNAAGVPLIALEKIDASEIYTAGDNAGYTRGYNSVTISEGYWEENYTKRVTASNQKYLIIDGTGVYENGFSEGRREGYAEAEQAVIDGIVIGSNSPESITHIGNNVYQMKVLIWARYNGDRIAATYIYPTKGIYS